MKKAELFSLVGKSVKVVFLDDKVVTGVLGYTEKFSEKFHYRKPGYFTVGHYDFKVSHIKKVCEITA